MQESNVVMLNNTRYKVLSGDELVRLEGERIANEELHGNGYQAKLTRFIEERDRKYAEEEAELAARRKLLEKRRNEKKAQEEEPAC